MDTVIFTSAHKTIGHTNWRVQVYEHPTYGRCTRYQWHDGSNWRNEKEHPRYNSHDGTYAGLPKGLRVLYYDNLPAIEYHLQAEPTQEFPMVPGDGAPQYTFDVPNETQLSLL